MGVLFFNERCIKTKSPEVNSGLDIFCFPRSRSYFFFFAAFFFLGAAFFAAFLAAFFLVAMFL
jgi:hypothetical protein